MRKVIATIVSISTFLIMELLFYLVMPTLSIRFFSSWFFVVLEILIFSLGIYGTISILKGDRYYFHKITKISLIVSSTILAIAIMISFISSAMFNSHTFANIASERVVVGNFEEDVPSIETVSDIALMDTKNAKLLGSTKLGSLSEELVNYKVENYSTIAINNKPYKVAPMEYKGLYRYLNNNNVGIPGYIIIDPVTQKAEYIKFDKNLQYVPSAFFSKDLKRHVWSTNSNKKFEGFYFEFDDEMNPYYVCPYIKNSTIFSAMDIEGVIIVNPVDGETKDYKVGEIPDWVDRVYDGDVIIKQYNWYGNYNNGFINSIFAQNGCFKTYSNYGYKVMDGDLWIFTGVLSQNSKNSNMKFVLMNTHTGEIREYNIVGAGEEATMKAVEGMVQEYGYKASFPSLINWNNRPTYVMVLKDDSGYTKMYALADIEDQSFIAVGRSQGEAFQNYAKLFDEEAPIIEDVPEINDTLEIEYFLVEPFVLTNINFAVIDGNSYAFLYSEENSVIYKIKVNGNEKVLFLTIGDTIENLMSEKTENNIQLSYLK